LYGLDAIAGAFEQLARRDTVDRRARLARWIDDVRGRGACRLPDGAAALARSALDVFAAEVDLHLSSRCSGTGPPVMPVPGERRTAA
jgi:hypothetical protein